jgi:hypothetical protein
MIAAEAAEMAAAQASTPLAAAARAAVIRRNLVPGISRGARLVVDVNIVGPLLFRSGRALRP